MPIDRHISAACPFLLESDVLSLSSAFRLSGTKLCDSRTGIAHRLRAPGEQIVQAIVSGNAVHRVRTIALQQHIRNEQLTELLGFLNIIGALERQRSWWRYMLAWDLRLRDALLGIRYAPFSWRRQASLLAVGGGVIRASRPVILSIGLVTGLAAAGGLVHLASVIGLAAFGTSTFVISLLAHEMAHVVIIQRYGEAADVLQRGMRLGIIHRRLNRKAELCSALAGPITGIAYCCMWAASAYWYTPWAAIVCLLVAAFHCSSWLPWYGDGQTIREALGSKKDYHELSA
ncbi:MAG TPA: hypothetical protein VJ836_00190 [Candidatus Saccharimonadales bacterium]|nr:hypothetical protein [Candidatus Saccharimonadales bacterium]